MKLAVGAAVTVAEVRKMSKSKLSQFRLYYEYVGTEHNASKRIDNIFNRLLERIKQWQPNIK